MDRASIAASLGGIAGKTLMKNSVLIPAVLVFALSSAATFAQNAPLRGVGLLALDAAQAPDRTGPLSSSRSALPESTGGGGVGARALRGGDDAHQPRSDGDAATAPDALPPKAIPRPIDAIPATPKHPSYRWQSLVPGAIK